MLDEELIACRQENDRLILEVSGLEEQLQQARTQLVDAEQRLVRACACAHRLACRLLPTARDRHVLLSPCCNTRL